ncbi:MAG TPA: type II toxin-antitoxin system HigB family toxin [Tepidisphaeraceae bacterium]|nr:type II toxin-antitoxin system HigB family toxin [Tepidisphaeraceae bacterium]
MIGRHVLDAAGRRNVPLRRRLAAWVAVVESATWQSLNDVRSTYPSADGVKLSQTVVVTVFNVKGNEYRLLTMIDYDLQTVLALEVLTHAEYDKNMWKRRY